VERVSVATWGFLPNPPHAAHGMRGDMQKNPSMEEAYDDCKPTKRILLVCKDLYVI